jgi:nicotinate-nucleotide pyrophosphorylase (carboxylating)
LALKDDVGTGDITTRAVIHDATGVEDAIILSKDEGIVCGLLEAKAILEEGGLTFESEKNEGDTISNGEIIARVHGDICELLKRERTVINYLQILSGIATASHELARRYPGQVASLRKYHPGLCFSEKRAVKVGGGLTHRLALYDGFLIKNNHLARIVRELFGRAPRTEEEKVTAINEALRRAKHYRLENQLEGCFIEIEVESLAQAVAAARFYENQGVPDMILLDNMQPESVSECVEAIRTEAGRDVLIEASGGVTAENIDAYIQAGVDVVSMSQLTLAAKPLDISMAIVGYK